MHINEPGQKREHAVPAAALIFFTTRLFMSGNLGARWVEISRSAVRLILQTDERKPISDPSHAFDKNLRQRGFFPLLVTSHHTCTCSL